jgi:chorismate synthase
MRAAGPAKWRRKFMYNDQLMLRFLTAGESHGQALVAILEGLPAGLRVDFEAITADLTRRQGGYGRGRRMAIETDRAEILSGVRRGETLGGPVAFLVRNKDWSNWQNTMHVGPEPPPDATGARRGPVTRPRPGHADLSGALKYDREDMRDILERASARETTMRVAAGSLARQLLAHFGIRVASHVITLGSTSLPDPLSVPFDRIAAIPNDSPLHCVDPECEARMIAEIDRARTAGDTLGGAVQVVAHHVPPGLGSHVQWDRKLDGRLAQALMSIPAIKAVGIGLGPRVAELPGSQVHDEIVLPPPAPGAGAGGVSSVVAPPPALHTAGGLDSDSHSQSHSNPRPTNPDMGVARPTNNAGGLEGGITNGEDVRVTIYMKPISTLMKPLRSVDLATMIESPAAIERSDVCAVPAAGVIAEAMVCLVLADAFLEKFGADSIAEIERNYAHTRERIRQRFAATAAASIQGA